MEIKNIDHLVSKVTASVIDKLDIKSTYCVINPKSCFILIPNMGLGMKEYIEYIINKYQGYELYLTSKENINTSKDFNNLNWIEFDMKNKNFVHLLDSVETIIVLGLKINQMKSVIQTDDQDEVNQLILESLLANKQVNVMMNANEQIFNKLKTIVNDLRHMGIYVTNIHQVKASSIVTHIEKEVQQKAIAHDADHSWEIKTKDIQYSPIDASSKYNPQSKSSKNSDEMIAPSINELITENYVSKLKNRNLKTIILNKKHLITPLAKDKLKELKIDIQYIEEAKS